MAVRAVLLLRIVLLQVWVVLFDHVAKAGPATIQENRASDKITLDPRGTCVCACVWRAHVVASFGFYDRRIAGVRVDEHGANDTRTGRFCSCFGGPDGLQPLTPAGQPIPPISRHTDYSTITVAPGTRCRQEA